MNISENFYHSARASLLGTAAGGERSAEAGSGFFASLEEMKRELADPESAFYKETYATMRQTLQENDERRKEEAIIDALMAAVDNMTGTAETESGLLGAKTGTELGLAQSGDPRAMMTEEMLAFLATLGGRDTLQTVEEEKTEAEKVRESGENRNAGPLQSGEGGELYAGSTERKVLSDEEISTLAQQYDPHHMEQEEFVGFMDTLEAAGALSPEAAEGIRNAGRWKVTVTEWRLEDGNGRVIDSGTGWTPPGRMDQMEADRWILPCLYDGGEDDGDVLAWARLGVRSTYAEGFQALADILQRMETLRTEETAKI